MKKLLWSVIAATCLLTQPAAQARDVIVGTNLLGLGQNTPNLFYQGRAFENSAFRVGGYSSGGSLTGELGFRFYFDRYADGIYLQGDLLAGGTIATDARLGIDLRLGNVIIDPYIASGAAGSNFGVNIGFHL